MRTSRLVSAALRVAAAVVAVGSASGGIADDVFTFHDLVSDTLGSAPWADPSLVNGWGLTAGPTTPWWVEQRHQ